MSTSPIPDLLDPALRDRRAALYRDTLLQDVVPFWLRHGLDREHGGMLTCLDRDGSVYDTDKSVWFQGRAGWLFATLCHEIERRADWLEASRSCVEFLRKHGHGPDGKLYFTVTRDGRPLRMRRYVYSESFAAIARAAYASASGDARAAEEALGDWERYLRFSFTPGVMTPKGEPTRPLQALGPHMIALVTAQELRRHLGDVRVGGRTCSEWIESSIGAIERDFFKPELGVLLENVGPRGEIVDHADGRILNPGHAIECAWFILDEARRTGDTRRLRLATDILDGMWTRGWDEEHGGLYYFRDLHHRPVIEYWHDMKFWWPHNEAILATLLAWQATGNPKYARWNQEVHAWSFRHFPDPQHGEWYGYLHRDGRVSSRAKGSIYKGPFHLPRMLLLGWQWLREPAAAGRSASLPPTPVRPDPSPVGPNQANAA